MTGFETIQSEWSDRIHETLNGEQIRQLSMCLEDQIAELALKHSMSLLESKHYPQRKNDADSALERAQKLTDFLATLRELKDEKKFFRIKNIK